MADTTTPQLPAFATRLLAASDEDRTSTIEAKHRDYLAHEAHWKLLIDAFEGTGGFTTGEYLWAYRNEREADYRKRQEMARYHNYVETIVDLYTQQVYSQDPARTTENEDLRAWWSNVDGHGTSMTAFLRKTVGLALAAGHAGILVDATTELPTGPAKADQKSRPFLTRYLATAITDWRTKDAEITGVKLCEAVPDGSIAEKPGDADEQYLLWDEEGWARFTEKGDLLEGGTPGLGLVPFEVVRPKPSVLRPFIGRSLFSHGKIIQAIYNRMSEEDQVLRDQAFSLLTVKVGPDGDVEQARKQIGEQIGTTIALVTQGEAAFIAPEMAVPQGIRENILQSVTELYRIAHMRYERGSLQAESAEAIRLQFKELNEMLQGLAAELQRVERQLAKFFFAWTSPTPEAAVQAFDAAKVVVDYPTEFFLADLILDLEAWAEAIAMDLGDLMTKRLKKKAVRRIEPELAPDDAAAIDAEIDAQPPASQQTLAGGADALRKGAQQRLNQLLGTTSAPQNPNNAGI